MGLVGNGTEPLMMIYDDFYDDVMKDNDVYDMK